MRRLSSLSSTTRIFLSDIGLTTSSGCAPQYASAPAMSQTRDVDLLWTFRLTRRDVRPNTLRAEPHGGPAPRQRTDGTLQFSLRAPPRRSLPSPHRGHRSRAVDDGVDPGDRRGPRLARAHLG